MKRTVFAAIAVSLMLLFVAALPQDKQRAKKMDQQKQMQMLEMMQDSALVNMMMEHMASDKGMRMKMMDKIIHQVKADSTGMMQMGKMMTDDKEMHAMMTKMMDVQKRDNLISTAQEILIKFNPGVQQTQVNALESEVGLEQIKVIPELNVRVFKITSSKSVKEVIAICEKKPFVKYAEPNYKYKALKNQE